MPDNGIKFFGAGGLKLDDAIEDRIEERLGATLDLPTGADVGRIGDSYSGVETYARHLVNSSPVRLDGLRIVLDCANGSAHRVGPDVFRALGATVVAIHDLPDGLNINENCGSTHLADLQATVVAQGADAGFAFDGDADRCLAVDASGTVIDGDQILALLALAGRDAGWLADDTVVATVMSNLGFLHAMQREGIAVRQTKVGDRYVLEDMRAGGFTLGGEQSGHVIMSDHATTGDGVLTAVHVAARIVQTGTTFADLASVMTRLPQVLINVPGVDKTRAETDPEVAGAVRVEADALGDNGRVLLRPSGTEPLVRVMVEATSDAAARAAAERIAAVVSDRLAL
jgi:phosphoglucosamine mutase